MGSDAPADHAAHSDYFVLHTGGLGDLVLLSHLVVSLKRAHPSAHLTVACRTQFAELLRCYPVAPDQVLRLSFNPYEWNEPGPALFTELRALYTGLAAQPVNLFIAAELKPTWFDWFVAAVLRPEQAVSCSNVRKPQGLLPVVLRHFGLEAPRCEGPQIEASLSEKERYERILAFLGVPPANPFPWSLDAGIRKQTEQRLSVLGLQPGRYLTCCPLGSGGASLKSWPAQRFHEVINWLREEFELPVLIIGSQREEPELRAFAVGVPGSAVFAGSDEELPLLTGLLANSRLYLGNDTGPAHVAEAYEVPAVVLFGGGHWPAYRPWARGCTALVHPMPCFGCDWDCLFGRGVCVTRIPVEAVVNTLREVLETPPCQPQIRTVPGFSDEVQQLIAAANACYRSAQRDRQERLDSILALQADAALLKQEACRREQELSSVIQVLEQAAAERLAALEQTTQALEQERCRAARREEELSNVVRVLEQAAAERLAALEQTTQALEQERCRAARREEELSNVIRVLEQAAAERLAALEQTTQALEGTRAELASVRSELMILRQESLYRSVVRRFKQWRQRQA